MTSIGAFLAELYSRKIRVWAEGDRLRFSAPRNAMTEALRAELIKRKAEILDFLNQAVSIGPMDEEPIATRVADEVEPLSFAQLRLWFLDRLEGPSPVYNVPAAFFINGYLDYALLERALRAIVDRHATLRTRIEEREGEAVQVVGQGAYLPISVHDLSCLPDNLQRSHLQWLADREAQRPFDLARGSLFRATLFRLAPKRQALTLVMHHIVSDGWSIEVLVRELGLLYRHFGGPGADQPAPLPRLPLQYTDFARWQRKRELDMAKALTFWRVQLAGAPERIDLPTDFSRPALQTFHGRRVSFRLEPLLYHGIRKLGLARNTTSFVTLQAVFAILLARYANQSDLNIGSPVASRGRPELEPLIGFFANTLVFRHEVEEGLSFYAYLARVRERTLAALGHQDVPFEKVVEVLRPQRSLSHAPLFQVMFTLRKSPLRQLKLPGIRWNPMHLTQVTARFDLTLSFVDRESRFEGELEYNTDLFRDDTAHRVAGHFHNLLRAVLEAPTRPLYRASMLSEVERRRMLVEWNEWQPIAPENLQAGSHGFFEAQALRTPEATALVDGAVRLSYSFLDNRAASLALVLKRHGVGPEVLTAVCLQRSPEMIVAMLAIHKAGGVLVPLDPVYPRDRLNAMLENVSLILSGELEVTSLPDERVDTLLLESLVKNYSLDEPGSLGRPSHPENLSHIIYTSGSTGRPKGAAITHRATTAMLLGSRRVLGLESGMCVAATTSVCFDLSVFEIFAPLSFGGSLILAADALELPLLESRHEVGLVNTVPSAMAELLRMDGLAPSVHTVNLAGEALPAELVEDLYRLPHIRRVFNLYGPSEDTTYSTWALVGPGQRPSIGRPFPNTRAFVLDPMMNPLPVGVPGMLFLAGDGLARGYALQPALTASAFLPNPFTESETLGLLGSRLYRTGDLARFGPDGRIDFLGRVDQQIKLRGFRIEPGEIESHLSSMQGVTTAAVVPQTSRSQELQLVAFIESSHPEFDCDEAHDFLASKLPHYMIPAFFYLLESLPRMPNGKVDRTALANMRPERGLNEEEMAMTRHQSATEEILGAIWSDVLGIGRIGVHENFFSLGGHSLLAVRIVSRVSRDLGIDMPLMELFRNPTIAKFAMAIDASRGRGSDMPPLTPNREARQHLSDEENIHFPPSFAQERLWLQERLQPASAHYNMSSGFQLEGMLDVHSFERSINHLLARHESLRTSFKQDEERLAQVIHPPFEWTLVLLDWRDLDTTTRTNQLGAFSRLETALAFDLSRQPLFRLTLIRLGDYTYRMLLTMHHIIADGWSAHLLVDELTGAYAAHVEGAEPSLPELPLQYADFATWQRQWLSGAIAEIQREYWSQKLTGLPPILDLPTDWPRSANASFDGGLLRFDFPPSLTEALKNSARAASATLYMTLQAGFALLLGRYSGQDEVAIGSAIANRTHPSLQSLIGFFTNVVVIRNSLSGNPTWQEFLERVRTTALEAYTHGDLPFAQVVEALRPVRTPGVSPVFQVMFDFINTPEPEWRLPGLRFSDRKRERISARFDLTLSVTEIGDRLEAGLEYRTELFEEATLARWMRHLRNLLEAVTAQPDLPVFQAPLTDPDAHLRLLSIWNRTREPVPVTWSVMQLVSAWAEKNPEGVALRIPTEDGASGSTTTYGDLERRSDLWAGRLRELAVQADSVVGICLDRSPEMILGLLASLQAGAAYLPLDPGYPRDRLAFLLHDAAITTLLTRERLLDKLPAFELNFINTLLLDDDPPETGQVKSAQPAQGQLAYLIYTSGSTGVPKGSAITHEGLANYLVWSRQAYGITEKSRVPLHSPLSFDATVTSLWLPLIAGGCIDLLPEAETLSHLARILTSGTEYDLVKLTPAHLDALAALIPPECGSLRVRRLVVGGEALSLSMLRRWFTLAPEIRMVNEYGPTETVVGCCAEELTATSFDGLAPIQTLSPKGFEASPDRSRDGLAPIGSAIANTRLFVMDPFLACVPLGLPGELCIAGVGLSRGYLNQPALTAAVFVPDPFGQECGARLYRSGDRVRRMEDGRLVFLGRRDGLVKPRGFRIELGEIESVLGQHSAVRANVVIPREDRPGQPRLVAYVAPETLIGTEEEQNEARWALADELLAWLAEKLPSYMLPAAILVLESLPLTAHGKIDRAALPKPEMVETAEARGFETASNRAEEILAEIWAETLGQERVDRRANFFALGGDSIIATRVIALAGQRGMRITLQQVFDHQTLSELAEAVGEPSVELVQDSNAPLGPAPLTPIQTWFFERPSSAPHHFNQALIFTVPAHTKPEFWKAATEALLQHHGMLRVRFEKIEDAWFQELEEAPDLSAPFELQDFLDTPEAEWPQSIKAAASRLQTGFQLTRAPLWRAAFLRRWGKDRDGSPLVADCRLLVISHHLLVDGVSWRILAEDLQTAYRQIASGEEAWLPPKTAAYTRWAERMVDYAHGGDLERELEFWLATVSVAHPSLPRDGSTSLGVKDPQATESFSIHLDAATTKLLLGEAPHALGVHINAVLLTALLRAFHHWTGAPFLYLDLEGHGRESLFEDLDISRTLGWFTSLFPLLLTAEDMDNSALVLASVGDQLAAIPNRGIGYGALRYLNETTASLLGNYPPPEVGFNYLGRADRVWETSGLLQPAHEPLSPSRPPGDPPIHLIDIAAMAIDGGLTTKWTYCLEIHHRDTIESLAHSFHEELRQLVALARESEIPSPRILDFPHSGLEESQLRAFLSQAECGGEIEDIYPLTPMQEGFLFHGVYEAASRVYFVQTSCEIQGSLNVNAFQDAWQRVGDRYPTWRTSFHWEGLEHPLQVVHAKAQLPWNLDDWRDLSEARRERRLEDYLERDRDEGFDLTGAPLMRFSLFRLDEDRYQFVWRYHHLLFDGWSLPILLREVFTFYEAIQNGLAPNLPAPRPFREYVAWLRGQDLDRAETHWRRLLADFTMPTPLGLSQSSTPGHGESRVRCRRRFWMPETETQRVADFAKRRGLTLSTVIQGAWALLLSRYSGERDVVFGTTISGRPSSEPAFANMVGLMINTLPTRASIQSRDPLVPWLISLQKQLVGHDSFAYSPLVKVQQWSGVGAHRALFNSVVVFENFPMDESFGKWTGSLKFSNMRGFERTNFPLLLTAAPGLRLFLELEYDDARFDEDAVARIYSHLRTMLNGMTADPDRRLGALPFLDREERQLLLDEWNRTEAACPEPPLIHIWFESRVKRNPDAIAVAQEKLVPGSGTLRVHALSYGELNRRANQLASRLRAMGVGPNIPVGICIERSNPMLVGLLAILKAGGAYAPMDPAYPMERLAYILRDSGAPVLLTQSRWLEHLPKDRSQPLLIDGQWSEIAAEPEQNLAPRVSGLNSIYLIYTSGSTGNPKGAGLYHGGFANMLHWFMHTFPFGPQSRVLLITSLSFDLTQKNIYAPLIQGGALCLPPSDRYDPQRFVETVQRQLIDWINCAPSSIYPLLEEAGGRAYAPLASLRHVMLGGEAIAMNRLRPWLDSSHCHARLINSYGPTETTDINLFHPIEEPAHYYHHPMPLGRPIHNNRLYVLDAELNPQPIGVVGELLIGGKGVGPGYATEPEKTAEKLIPDPFSTNPGERLYCSGDRVRYFPNGNLEFVARVDHQIKLRGFRVELGEIEAVLARHPSVGQVAVLVWEGAEDGDALEEPLLVAYLALKDVEKGKALFADLREHLEKRLPEYMVPQSFVIIDHLPLTPNGKLDRKSLPAPDMGINDGGENQTENPRTETESSVAAIWAEVLGRTGVNIHDNFFEMGGHSLTAAKAITRLREAFGLEIPLQFLFAAPTVAQFSTRLADLKDGEEPRPSPSIRSLPREGLDLPEIETEPGEVIVDLPLSFSQQRLWFLDQLEGPSAVYNLASGLVLEGGLNRAVLQQGLQTIVQRHEALRTRFVSLKGQPLPVIQTRARVELPVIDLRGLPFSSRESVSEAMVRFEAQRPFDLAAGPLCRATLIWWEEKTHLFLVTLHHLVSDDWSGGLLVTELSACYRAAISGEAPTLPRLPIQYADYAAWQRERLAEPSLAELERFWVRYLEGAPPLLELPTDRPRPPIQCYRGAERRYRLENDAVDAFRKVCQAQDATMFMGFQAIFALLLSRYSGQDDIVLGVPVANRDLAEIEPLIGFFVNTLALRSRMEDAHAFGDLLQRTREKTLEAFAHAELPFERVVDKVQPIRSQSHGPLFQVLFNLLTEQPRAPRLPGIVTSPMRRPRTSAMFDLALTLVEEDGGFHCVFEYNTDLFDAATVQRIGGAFTRLAQAAAARPDIPSAALPMLDEEERKLLLNSFQPSDRLEVFGQTALGLFETCARRGPDAIALVCGSQRISYACLNREADHLARALRIRMGHGENLVAICLDRKPSLIQSMLAVHKADAAYIPLDPTYPEPALARMLEHADLIITEPGLAKLPPAHGLPVVTPSDTLPSDSGPERLPSDASGLSHVIYTSGSTGVPKGVAIRHQSTAVLCHWAQNLFGKGDDPRGEDASVVLAATSVCFDLSIFEIFASLARGGRVLIVDEPTRGVDVGAKAAIHAVLDELACAGVAVLLISSDLPEVLGLSTTVAVMHEGRMTARIPRSLATPERVLAAMSGR